MTTNEPIRSAIPSTWTAALRIFDLTLGEMLWSRRSLFLAVIVGGPTSLALILRLVSTLEAVQGVRIDGAQVGGPSIFGVMIWLLYIRVVVPVLGVFYGTSLIADEVDDKTITYLFTRPIPRRAVVLGKYLGYLVCTTLLVLPSVVIVFFLVVPINGGRIGSAVPSLLADLGLLGAALAAYGAVFTLIGARLKRPIVIGLVFAFGWEPGVLLFPGYLKRLTVGYYVQGLVPHAMPQDSTLGALLQLFAEPPTLAASLAGLAVITAGSLWLAGRAAETREYVLEQ